MEEHISQYNIFPVKAVSLIFDLGTKAGRSGRSHLEAIKDVVIPEVMKIESDDRVYVYHPDGDLGMFDTVGEVVAAVSDFGEVKVDVPMAVKESLWLVKQYEPAHRAVFVFTNRFPDAADGRLREALAWDGSQTWGGELADVFVYGVGFGFGRSLRSVSDAHPKTRFRHVPEPEDLTRFFPADFSDLIVER